MAQVEQTTYTEEEQEKLLDSSRTSIKEQSFYMKRCLDQGKLMDGLKHASNMICELRTGMLSPRKYYDLYMNVFDQLRHLESYLLEEHRKGRKMSELYEVVQYAGNILPRMYLLITVGSVYIQSAEAATKDVLKDLVEMCRGVQHPMRGLFLRNFLSQLNKDKLPDAGTESESNGGVLDSIEFICQNFTEMNKLWVRLQHQGPVRDRDKREKERLELRILVGTNLVRLSQLEGVTVPVYKEEVLPRIIEQIINCKDQIAQQYLMECAIQVFSDDLHLATLETLLESCAHLHQNVNVKDIIVSLMDRIATYAKQFPNEVPDEIQIFDIFSEHVTNVIQSRPKMALADVLSLQAALLNLSTKVYPENLGYVDKVFATASSTLQSLNVTKVDSPACVKQVVELLTLPVEAYDNIVTVLDLEHYPSMMNYLDYNTRKKVSVTVVNRVLRSTPAAVGLSDPDKVNKLLEFIRPLIRDEEDQPADANEDTEDFEEEQNLVARLIHFWHNDDTDITHQILLSARKHFGHGGPKRLRHTLVPLVFRSLDLAARIRKREDDGNPGSVPCKKVFRFVHEVVTGLAQNYPEIALRLFLNSGLAADQCSFDAIAYEFITQAFVIYEDEISDSRAQFKAINMIVGTLQNCNNFSEDNYDTLITKSAQYSSKLLKKPDQCRAVYLCSHLFWSGQEGGYRNGKRVLECLQKALKIADTCVDSIAQVQLFVEILNEYLFYFEGKNEAVTANYLSVLISLINTKTGNIENTSDDVAAINLYYQNTLSHINARKQGEDDPRYEEIQTV